ncbi:hypothetical protein AB0C38_10365 [Amycolatopsis sp. NPDC048633]|uniref:hypothetical protein n=1 Tax=Amycolatopsis sp. NPDC048633 TaxID=3157095 RepID=UPI0033D2F9F1
MSIMPNWGGAGVGRYKTRCPPGVCQVDPVPGTSKLEAELFNQLNYVLGDGVQHWNFFGRKVDMMFNIDSHGLIVEYDGAYWHRGRERSDREKAELLSEYRLTVIRVREDPLRPLRHEDLWVPKGADAILCARLVLLHAMHLLRWRMPQRAEGFLIAAAAPLDREQVPCRSCWSLARRYRRRGDAAI